MMRIHPLSRRAFAKSLAIAPVSLAASSAVLGQIVAPAESKPAQSPAEKKKSDSEYNRHPPVHEEQPFDEPLRFARKPLNPRIKPFALKQVRLDSGRFQQTRDWSRGYMLRLPNERLLYNFRATAGLPSGATPLGGWEAPTSELRGHFVGHYLSASSFLIGSSGDPEMKAKADGLVAGIAECQAALGTSGYVSAFPEELFVRLDRREKVWAPFYTLHKIMAGLLDMYVQTGNQQAMDILLKLAAWVDGWTASKAEEHMQEILKTEYGGMNDVLYRLAVVTSDDRWARTGDRFTKKIFFTPLALQRDELYQLHVNTHVPQVIGAAQRYEISSDARFRNVSGFFWETVTESRTYATGGSGNTESWLTHPHNLAPEMKVSSHHQECCCAYNMMKLTRHLYGWTGEVRYMDYYERNLLNHRIGTIEPGTGLTTYFLSMSPGAWKTLCTEDESFWCCTGTALEDFAKLNDSIYFHDEDSVYVNLFVASHLDWSERGIRLRQQTSFPEENRTVLTVESTSTERWTMRLRIPSWTDTGSIVRLNGHTLEVSGTPGSYLTIARRWKPGDRVELVMPMRIYAEAIPDEPTIQAFLYGPIVLAGQFPRGQIADDFMHKQGPELQEASPVQVPTLSTGGRKPDEWITPVTGSPLTFRTAGQAQDVTLKPLSESWDRFAVYWTTS
jgi:DUF1680 family protein